MKEHDFQKWTLIGMGVIVVLLILSIGITVGGKRETNQFGTQFSVFGKKIFTVPARTEETTTTTTV